MKTLYDIQTVLAYLPHRYPFLLIDRVVAIDPGEKITALKNVTYNEPFFQGHFPQQPIMPGVLLVEAMAQAGGVLAFESRQAEQRGAPVYFMGIDKVKFRKPVVPGDQLILEARLLKLRSKAAKLSGRAFVSEALVAEAEFMATFGSAA